MTHVLRALLTEVNNYSPKVRNILNQYQNEEIQHLDIQRTPISSALRTTLNVISLGQTEKNISHLPFDKLYHLRIVMRLKNGKEISLEKNERINMDLNPQKSANTESLLVPIHKQLKLGELLEKTKQKMGSSRFFTYSATDNNCQTFIKNVLEANGLSTSSNIAFVKQDTKALFEKSVTARKIANSVTTIARRLQGRGLSKGNGTTDIQLERALKDYSNFNGVYSKDTIPKVLHEGWYIINMANHNKHGTHWTCFKWLKSGSIIYCDSFGVLPAQELVDRAKGDIVYSIKEIQAIGSTACGYFCLACIAYDDGKPDYLKRFLAYFSRDDDKNDKILYLMLKKKGIVA